jgi:acetyl esterase/lipase
MGSVNRGDFSITEMRKFDEEETAKLPLPEGLMVEQVADNDVKGEWVRTVGVRGDAALFYLHGGAYVFCSAATHRQLVAALSEAAGVAAFALDYRLAPESPFPAAVEDAVNGYRWLLSQGFAPERIVIAGDSAGGGLAVATLVAARDAGLPMPAAAVCISPWADLTITAESYRTRATEDPTLGADRLKMLGQVYLNGADDRHPLASPVFANLAGLPPLLIQVGTAEVLYDDSISLDATARAAGVDSHLEVWEEMVHVWHFYHWMLGEGRRAIARIGEFVKAKIGGPTTLIPRKPGSAVGKLNIHQDDDEHLADFADHL